MNPSEETSAIIDDHFKAIGELLDNFVAAEQVGIEGRHLNRFFAEINRCIPNLAHANDNIAFWINRMLGAKEFTRPDPPSKTK